MPLDEVPPEAPLPAAPPELMRKWHPDLFSDSERVHMPVVPRAVLDHHLETLTNRKEEDEFEYFARLLAERELCPNLRPQTGPTGGGDSKVDTETYPVAHELAMRWFHGQIEAASERWAFAFSAKKKWRDKVKSDVESIVSTKRPYARIFFITNQYAPEKSRADAEDKLTALAGIPVTILDRSWILEKIYANNLIELAIRSLNMTGFSELVNLRVGPRDAARQEELAQLDKAVADPERYRGARYALAEDALQSALLARGLERPRSEIEGRFLAAARIAEDVGHARQRLRIAYQRAWTAYWWFDDPSALSEQYEVVAEVALASDNAADLEELLTLWQLLAPAAARGTLKNDKAAIAERGAVLTAALERVAANGERPNNAAHAQTYLQVLKIAQLMQESRHNELAGVWDRLRAILAGVEGMGDYPLERVHELIARMGEVVPESATFDAMFEDLVVLIERRRSEAEGALAYMRRGEQKLAKGLQYDAIRLLGRAETRLIKAEYVDELVHTLILIAGAYREAGLKWAARAKALMAADKLLSGFARSGQIDPRAAVPAKLLAWIEIELGRVPQAVGAIGLYRMLVAATEQPEAIAVQIPQDLQLLEATTGMLLMRADLEQLRALERFPAVLEREDLLLTRAGLLWALVGERAVRDDGFFPPELPSEEIEDFFDKWMNQPAALQIPPRPILAEGALSELRTVVLGVEIIARVANDPDSIFLSEAILAALESFLATSLGAGVFPYRERLVFTVIRAENPDAGPNVEMDALAGAITVTHGAGSLAGAADYPAFTTWLQELLVRLSMAVFVIREPERWLERVAGEEVGFGRALALSAVGIATRNIFGDSPRVLLSDWIDPADLPHRLERDAALPPPSSIMPPPDKRDGPIRFGEGEPLDALDREAGKHSERRVLSPIDIPLWNRAAWRATCYAFDANPPLLLFAFEDYAAGEAIFRGWRERYGPEDVDEMLRIALVRGIDRENPCAYKVHVSSEIGGVGQSGSLLFMASRINRMTPASSANLDQFLKSFSASSSYAIGPIPFQPVEGFQNVDTSLLIRKRKLVVRQAWEIAEHDPDMQCLDFEDIPVIPDHATDAPVLRTLEWLRQTRGRSATANSAGLDPAREAN